MYNRVLPPLDLLIPFEAAARLSSFTLAAAELNVSQSAVSQRIRTLEDHLGTALFVRTHRKITLTTQGREMLNGATVALQHLSAAAASVRRTEQDECLHLAVDTTIAAMWLMPRLTAFSRHSPDVTVNLTTSDHAHDALTADIAILHGEGDWPGFVSTKLFGDVIFPVCAPAYLVGREIAQPEDLLAADMIDLDYQYWNWMNWSIWMTEIGLDAGAVRRVFQSNSYPAVISAAKDGWGVALGWENFLDKDLASGTLVRPLGQEVATRFGYYIALRAGAPNSAKTFHDWLLAKCGVE